MSTRFLPVSATSCLKSAGIAFALLASCSAPRVAVNSEELCEEFRVLLSQRTRLSAFAVEGVKTGDDSWSLPNVDFDADSVEDQVVSQCPGSASIIPADPCTLEAKSSLTGKSFVLEEQRLYVVRFKALFYVVAGRMTDERGPMTTDIYLLTSAGPERICSYECDPKTGCK